MKILRFVLLQFVIFTASAAQGGSATWKPDPASGDWNTAANWDPATVPNQPTDIATFDFSNTTQISVSFSRQGRIDLDRMVFNSGASAYTVTATPTTHVYLDGSGIINNSGVTQNLVSESEAPKNGYFSFANSSTVVGPVTLTNLSSSPERSGIYGGQTLFNDASSAGEAIIINEGGNGRTLRGGQTIFAGTATAANARITAEGGKVPHAQGADVTFNENATAGEAVITVGGGSGVRSTGATIHFEDGSTAGHAVLTANGGEKQGGGGYIFFDGDSDGESAQIRIYGNAKVDFFGHNTNPPDPAIGSLEGNGIANLGSIVLNLGGNNRSTIFSGQLRFGAGLHKVGRGRLVLTGDNSFGPQTTIDDGILEISNQTGSGTGSGPVQVNGGILSGEGFIAGAVTVGTGSGSGAALNPGRSPANPRTLTLLSTLNFQDDGTFDCDLNSDTATADQVVANGVTIGAAAAINLSDAGTASLPSGTTLTVINNTAATSISGSFNNLPDSGTISVGSNTFQVSYEGGDGNDLTLTVVP